MRGRSRFTILYRHANLGCQPGAAIMQLRRPDCPLAIPPPHTTTSDHTLHTMRYKKISKPFFCILASLSLVACGGSGGDASISGVLSGLGAGLSVALKRNTTETITATSNGPFAFTGTTFSGSGYGVTVVTQPLGQRCVVTNGAGTVDNSGTPITNVAVACAFNSSVGATVTGLATGVTLILSNGSALLKVTANGSSSFDGYLTPGSTYNVFVSTQPIGHTCTVINPSGLVLQPTDPLPLVQVTCV